MTEVTDQTAHRPWGVNPDAVPTPCPEWCEGADHLDIATEFETEPEHFASVSSTQAVDVTLTQPVYGGEPVVTIRYGGLGQLEIPVRLARSLGAAVTRAADLEEFAHGAAASA